MFKERAMFSRNTRSLLGLLVAAMLGFVLVTPAQADNAAWTGATDAGWFTAGPPTNWDNTPGAVPGTGNTATFNGAGNGNVVIDVATGGPLTINTILFDTNLAAAYTIGTGGANGQSLTLDDNAAVTMNGTVANNELFNAAITLGTTVAGGTTTVTNNSTTRLVRNNPYATKALTWRMCV
jgi:hypothetical protein